MFKTMVESLNAKSSIFSIFVTHYLISHKNYNSYNKLLSRYRCALCTK